MADSVVGSDFWNQQGILDEARRLTGLEDFGPDYFLEPMARQLDAIRREAKLSKAGAEMQRGRMVTGLVARLRMFQAIREHPEIAAEEVRMAGVILGMARTGSTMFHRMLAVAPGVTALRWWEAQNYAPFPGEARGQPVARKQAAEKILEGYVKAGMLSIHPFAIDAPDEEMILLDQFYVGTMPESVMYVPSYSDWLDSYDYGPAYQDLKTVLKFLQWQDPGRKGKRWVLKAPGHLYKLDTLVATFPDAKLIMTHRLPIETIPSYCSMVKSLVGMASDAIDPVTLGQFTERQWAKFLRLFTEARDRIGGDRFIDVRYEDLVRDPVAQAGRVLAHLGIAMNQEIEAAMRDWLAENARDKRAAHHYTMEEFGLTETQLNRDFAFYVDRFF